MVVEQVLEKASLEVILRSVRGPCADWLEELDKADVDYRIKANLAMTGVWASPCIPHEKNNYSGCRWVRSGEKDYSMCTDSWCCLKCGYPLDIKLMSVPQLEGYKKERAYKRLDYLNHPENEALYLALLSKEEVNEIVRTDVTSLPRL